MFLCCLFLTACGGSGGGDAPAGGGGGGGGGTPALPYTLLSDDVGGAQLQSLEVAFDGAGNGVAVWLTRGLRSALVYATFDAVSDSWSADQTLVAAGETAGSFDYAVASGDTAIAAVFTVNRSEVFASVFSNGQFAEPQLLDEVSSSAFRMRDVAIASTGDSFAAVWSRTVSEEPRINDIRASVLAPGAAIWAAAETISMAGPDTTSFSPRIISNGSGYTAAVI